MTSTKGDCTLSAPILGILPQLPMVSTPFASPPLTGWYWFKKAFAIGQGPLERICLGVGRIHAKPTPNQILPKLKLGFIGTILATKYLPHQERIDNRRVYKMPEQRLVPFHTLPTCLVVRGHLVGDINTSLAKIIIQDNLASWSNLLVFCTGHPSCPVPCEW